MSAPDRSASGQALVVIERPLSLVQVMARKDRTEALAAAIAAAFGVALPPPGKWAGAAGVEAIWIAPGAWLLAAEPGPPGAFRSRVAAAAGGFGAAVEQSSGRSAIRVEGAGARAALATLCRLDLHPRVFGPGSAAATRIAHVACAIRLVGSDAPAFELLVGSTYARWLIEALAEAAHGAWFTPAPAPWRSAIPPAEDAS